MTGTVARIEKKNPLGAITGFFKGVVTDFIEGDIFVKLSALVMGAGYFRRKQIIKGIIVTLFQAVIILFAGGFGRHYLSRIGTLGSVEYAPVFNFETMKNEINDYDHSFQILLFGVVSIIVLAVAFMFYLRNIRNVRALELRAKSGLHIHTFLDDVRSAKDERFHITLLTFPCLGIVLFTIVPLIIMITVAFTNYDQLHMPPASLFTWVGLENFKALFSNNIASSFGYAFGKVLSWTLIWAFAATFSNFFLGIMLASFINNAKTKLKRVWRTGFIVSIAVPQFVTLLIVRNFFARQGIANTLAADIGLTSFLQNIGLSPAHLDFIPFLTDPNWAKVMVILINIWIGIPFTMLIATGVLMNIPKELYESAKIDGASPFKQYIYITMPYMLFVTAPFMITQVVHNINNFNVIYLLTQDIYTTTDQALAAVNAKEIDLLVTWLHRLTQEQYDYKMASVIGIMVFVVCAVFTLIAFNLVIGRNKEDKFQL
ncbi:MAG: sugar ABC transporter permease [Oscillospiraceae bacterium]|nr:sugar ABC transporter permease [Oscillospiraceae bacterium]